MCVKSQVITSLRRRLLEHLSVFKALWKWSCARRAIKSCRNDGVESVCFLALWVHMTLREKEEGRGGGKARGSCETALC